jgi:hypothetical protein
MASKSMSSGLDYNIDNLDERRNKVEQIINHNDGELVTYFDDYYNPSLTQNARLSENDLMCMQLERMADYLLYADNKEKRKENHGDELHIVNGSDDEKNKKKEMLTDELSSLESGGKKVNQHKLYKKVKVTKEDRELYPELADTGELIENLKKMIETGRDSHGNEISEDAMRKIRWYLIDIRKDEVAMKEMLKGYIRFKRLSPEGDEPDYSGFSFDNVDHVRTLFENYSELKQNSFDDTHGDIKIILEVFEKVISLIDFDEYMFDIFIYKIDGLSRKKIVNNIRERHNIEFSESRISQITKKLIPEMIVETYKKSYQDWVYTFVIKGIYKTCNKCCQPKLVNNFGTEKRSKDGRRTICNDCRKSK